MKSFDHHTSTCAYVLRVWFQVILGSTPSVQFGSTHSVQIFLLSFGAWRWFFVALC